ncbi:MAG: hypothetical protein IPN34_05455 [Planctomycetes bacterium]|nr:hypothetical protein [Planctomycetota bacterium]
MQAKSPRRRRASLALALLLPLGGCTPTALEPTGAAGQAAADFLAACAAGDDAAWRAHLVSAEREDPQWSRAAFPGGRVIDLEQRERRAIARFVPADGRASTQPLVLRLEGQSWRVSLAESMAAWVAAPPRSYELLARP